MLAMWLPLTSHATTDAEKAQTVVHMLDYIGVDYPGTVKDGRVQDASEYAEQREFAGQVLSVLGQLPPVADKQALLSRGRFLIGRIEAKAPGIEVTGAARSLAADVVQAYRVPTAPKMPPDLGKATALFLAHCAACHGSQGRGDGAAASALSPSPSNFHDDERMSKRSLYGMYNTITLGVGGTSMRAFPEFAEADRWALAFLVGSLRSPGQQQREGEALWRSGTGKAELGSLRLLVSVAPEDLSESSAPPLDAVRAYLTRNPAALAVPASSPLDVARAKLQEAAAAYRAGDRASARQFAITAYLEGFELVEAGLNNVDTVLRRRIEEAMMALRTDIDAGKGPEAFDSRVKQVLELLDDAQEKLAAEGMSPAAAFTSALLILLREGLEAILVLAAIVAFVRKTGRRDALMYVHVGWMAAVLLGVATWFAASRFLEITGASREVTEGVSALLAAGMLLYVGLWLHSRANAQAWQSFIRDRVNGALGKRTLWAMAGISFLAVYRELFEVILFYETLWAQAGEPRHDAIVAGIGAGAICLALLAWAILRYSVRLPLGLFFSATSWLLVALAVVFVGHGIAALQEAGWLVSTPVPFLAVPLLGVHANLQGLVAQGATVVLTLGALLAGRRSTRN